MFISVHLNGQYSLINCIAVRHLQVPDYNTEPVPITTESDSRNRLAIGQSRSHTDCNQTQSRSDILHITLQMKLQLSWSHRSDVSFLCFKEAWKLSQSCSLLSVSSAINDFSMMCCIASAPDPADVMIHLDPGENVSAVWSLEEGLRQESDFPIQEQIQSFQHNRWLQTMQNTSSSFPVTLMSLNVFCSCGRSAWTIQINLPRSQCLLDKTWHIGFFGLLFPPPVLVLSQNDGWSHEHLKNLFKSVALINCTLFFRDFFPLIKSLITDHFLL